MRGSRANVAVAVGTVDLPDGRRERQKAEFERATPCTSLRYQASGTFVLW